MAVGLRGEPARQRRNLMIKRIRRFLADRLNGPRLTFQQLETIKQILVSDYLNKHLYGNEKYRDPKRLNRYEQQVYSQYGEDGIIGEIFRRIGATNKFFVEFGVGDGLECNTTLLLNQSWNGCWIEANGEYCARIRSSLKAAIEAKALTVRQAFVTAEDIESLFAELRIPPDLDLLSIDIDRNDYWVWKAINSYKPRVVVIEYNSFFPGTMRWGVPYRKDAVWNRDTYFNSSLKSLELLGREKGYSLVGCSFAGVNAFFVRDDLVGDHFLAPYSAETHYEPPRYFLQTGTFINKAFGEFKAL
jgi:hypothetical protein